MLPKSRQKKAQNIAVAMAGAGGIVRNTKSTEGRNTQRQREEKKTGNTNGSRPSHPTGNSTGADTHI